ncbi:hypothetical protein Goshw_008352, partial [Gossypium schwendimanii]|nr:hypothetical protein [Gossypium schwendimanii]
MASSIYCRQRRGSGNCVPKGTTWPFKSKKNGRRRRFINEARTITRPIINTH